MTPEKQVAVLQRRLDQRQKYWLRAARAALEGDFRELRLRVAMADEPPCDVVLSDQQRSPKGD